jgi:hypothetical protein
VTTQGGIKTLTSVPDDTTQNNLSKLPPGNVQLGEVDPTYPDRHLSTPMLIGVRRYRKVLTPLRGGNFPTQALTDNAVIFPPYPISGAGNPKSPYPIHISVRAHWPAVLQVKVNGREAVKKVQPKPSEMAYSVGKLPMTVTRRGLFGTLLSIRLNHYDTVIAELKSGPCPPHDV